MNTTAISCYICAGHSQNGSFEPIFEGNCKFESGKQLHQLVGEIIGRPVTKAQAKSGVLCQDCLHHCIDYEGCQTKLAAIKQVLQGKFKLNKQSTKNLPGNIDRPVVISANKMKPIILMKKPNTPIPIPSTSAASNISLVDEISSLKEYSETDSIMDFSIMSKSLFDNKKKDILAKSMEVIQSADDSEGTILMQRGDGSFLRVSSGQKIIYGDNEISLIIPEDNDDDDADQIDEEGDGNDGQDSNDESQIELQVSGDEETANAIIAATREQGAFIEVESGEVFRVKSVQSKVETKSKDEVIKSFVEKIDDAYVCTICANKNSDEVTESSFSTAEAIMRHLRSAHAARVYVCAVCGQLYRRRCDYTKHVATHGPKAESSKATPAKRYECDTCGKKLASRSILSEHVHCHLGLRPHACQLCGKTFASKYTFQAHQKTHLDRPRPFQCPSCPKSFYTQQNLNQHQKTHSTVRDFRCTECDKTFLTQHNLEVHSLVHSGQKPFACPDCPKAFARRPELADHARTHTGERPFVCPECGAAFAQRSNLQSHRRLTHRGEKRHECDTCGQRFKRRRLLQYHIKARHTGERPFQCGVCGAAFVYPEHYKKHRRIHNGEKPYDCEVCGRLFSSRDSRNAHRFVHSDRKPYECIVCGSGYMRRPQLYAHMNACGHLTECIVINQPKINKKGDKETLELETESTIKEATPELLANAIPVAVGLDEGDGIITETVPEADDDDDNNASILMPVPVTDELMEITKSTNLADIQLASGSQEQIIANDENGAMVRLVQIKLPNGSDGWIAIN